jgi:hypothetical protein
MQQYDGGMRPGPGWHCEGAGQTHIIALEGDTFLLRFPFPGSDWTAVGRTNCKAHECGAGLLELNRLLDRGTDREAWPHGKFVPRHLEQGAHDICLVVAK